MIRIFKPKTECFKNTDDLYIYDYVTMRGNRQIQRVAEIIDSKEIKLEDIKVSTPIQDIFPLTLQYCWIEALIDKESITKYIRETDGYTFYVNHKKLQGVVKLRYVHEFQHILRLIEKEV